MLRKNIAHYIFRSSKNDRCVMAAALEGTWAQLSTQKDEGKGQTRTGMQQLFKLIEENPISISNKL
jgi:hypothetical protein